MECFVKEGKRKHCNTLEHAYSFILEWYSTVIAGKFGNVIA